jgi:hypothetical protein
MGVFIYKTKGHFPNNFIMEGVDILLMSKGSSAEVGYVTDAELIGDLCDLNLEEYSRAMIHSHHSMSTNPSGTDINELKSAASTGHYYLSVIVNNNLDITALVGIKKTYKGTVKSVFKNLFGKYTTSKTQDVEYEDCEIIECEVVKEYPKYMLDINQRIEKKLQNYNTSNHPKRAGYKKEVAKKVPVQAELFSDEFLGDSPIDDLSLYSDFIVESLKSYCYYTNGAKKTPSNAIMSIENDVLGVGIPISYYVAYLEKNVFESTEYTQQLLKELKSPIEWV